MKSYHLKRFKLYLNDRTIVFPDVHVVNTGNDIRIITNPLMLSVRPVKPIGICAFDEDGILGLVIKLPRSMWRMIRANSHQKPKKMIGDVDKMLKVPKNFN